MTSFLDLHRPGSPLLLPNPWDAGSARVLAALGFAALATTSSGFAATLGPAGHDASPATRRWPTPPRSWPPPTCRCRPTWRTASPTTRPGWPRRSGGHGRRAWPAARSRTRRATTPTRSTPRALAVERIEAAVEAAGDDFVVTARAENHLHGRDDLADTIARLQAFQAAGAHVLYAPGVVARADLASVLASVDRPLNVLALAQAPPVAVLAELGVARISVGGAFAFAALGALVDAATEFRDAGTYGFWDRARTGRGIAGDGVHRLNRAQPALTVRGARPSRRRGPRAGRSSRPGSPRCARAR